jgi:hypothetical protein
LEILFEQDGNTIPFVGGNRTGYNVENGFIDLSYDHAVTRQLTIKMTGPDISTGKIHEITVMGKDPAQILHKITPAGISASANTSRFYHEDYLIDNNPRTMWKVNTIPPVRDRHTWKIKDYLHTIYNKIYDTPPGEGEAVIHLPNLYIIEEIALYFPENNQGETTLSTWQNGEWVPAAVIPEQLEPGWHRVEILLLTDKIRIQSTGAYDELGFISEVEVWGYGTYPGDSVTLIGTGAPGVMAEPVNLTFFDADVCEKELEVIFTGDALEELAIQLNGTTFTASSTTIAANQALYRFPLPGQTFFKGNNFLRINPPGEETRFISARVREKAASGIVSLDHETLGDRFLFTPSPVGDDTIVAFGRTLLVRNIQLYTSATAGLSLLAWENGMWTEILPDTENPYTRTYTVGKVMEKLRLLVHGDEKPGEIQLSASPVCDQGPEVSILWPGDGARIPPGSHGFHYVIGFVDNPGAAVRVNGIETPVKGHIFYLPLKNLGFPSKGVYDITAEAVDPEGRRNTDSITIITGIAPLFFIDQADEIIYTDQPSVTITGRMTSRRYQVFVNHEPADMDKRKFSGTVELTEGLNIIPIQLYDKKNGRLLKTIERKAVLYTGEVTLTIDTPQPGSYTSRTTIVVQGRVEGCGATIVTVNGTAAEVAGATYTSKPVDLSEGVNALTVHARDTRG